jgi:hypothetical protein
MWWRRVGRPGGAGRAGDGRWRRMWDDCCGLCAWIAQWAIWLYYISTARVSEVEYI